MTTYSEPDPRALTASDRRLLHAIQAAPDQKTIVELIALYWRDADRADRTPRSYIYFHLGLLLAPAILATGANVPPPSAEASYLLALLLFDPSEETKQ